ncbi:MAG: divalent-cation tolerance protein CutA [bacterium]|nr:divalent-cation tolerance protein CutA [bacterium]
MKYIQIFTATGTRKDAEKIARKLLVDKLAGCVQIFPVLSMYRWKGKVEKSKEYLCIIKTKKGLYKKVEKVIKEMHSYDVPEILVCDIVSGSKDYIDWLEQETGYIIKRLKSR